jgi:hypothetical protein
MPVAIRPEIARETSSRHCERTCCPEAATRKSEPEPRAPASGPRDGEQRRVRTPRQPARRPRLQRRWPSARASGVEGPAAPDRPLVSRRRPPARLARRRCPAAAMRVLLRHRFSRRDKVGGTCAEAPSIRLMRQDCRSGVDMVARAKAGRPSALRARSRMPRYRALVDRLPACLFRLM